MIRQEIEKQPRGQNIEKFEIEIMVGFVVLKIIVLHTILCFTLRQTAVLV